TTILVGSSTARALRPRELLLVSKQSARALPGVLRARSRLRQGTGRGLLPPSPLFPAQGDLSIFPVPEWMQPADRRRDPSCHYVGPAADLESRAEEADPELEAFLDTEEAVVLLSLGTLHAVGESFLRSCLEAFGRFPARVLISGGPGADPAALGPLPSHVLARRPVPQLAVLRRADVFVTHGGLNSVLESRHFGVPMVVLPQQLEQLLIAQAVAERGAGRVLRQHLRGADVPPARLRATVGSLLGDRTGHHPPRGRGSRGGRRQDRAAARREHRWGSRPSVTGREGGEARGRADSVAVHGGSQLLPVHDRVRVALLGEEALAMGGVVLVLGVAHDHGVEVRGAAVGLGAQQATQSLGLLLTG